MPAGGTKPDLGATSIITLAATRAVYAPILRRREFGRPVQHHPRASGTRGLSRCANSARILAKATVGRWANGKDVSPDINPTNDVTLLGHMPKGPENAYEVMGRSNLDPCQP